MRRWLSVAIYGMSAVIGIAAFAYPFLLPQLQGSASMVDAGSSRTVDAPLLTMALLIFSLLALLLEMQGEVVSAKMVAALGILVAVASVLRFIETAIPGPGGFSFVFTPIILAGYVFGARFGFLMGAMTMLVSALIIGGVGPWLPYQMFVAAWVGFTAGWLPHPKRPGWELALLITFGIGWGMLYGAITNLYFWPFVAGEPGMSWEAGAGLGTSVARYGAFYFATSFWWDLARSAGNVILLLAVGRPAVRALARFRNRFQFEMEGRNAA